MCMRIGVWTIVKVGILVYIYSHCVWYISKIVILGYVYISFFGRESDFQGKCFGIYPRGQ